MANEDYTSRIFDLAALPDGKFQTQEKARCCAPLMALGPPVREW
jgi:hypothetical protein